VVGAIALLFAVAALAESPLEVVRGTFRDRLLLTGELVAADAHRLIAPNVNIWPLQIQALPEDGADVSAGDLLVEFDNGPLVEQIDQLERKLDEATRTLASLEAKVGSEELEASFRQAQKQAELDKAAIDAVVPRDLLSDKDYEERQVALERAQLALTQAAAALELKRESVAAQIARERVVLDRSRVEAATAAAQLDALSLRAPRDAVVVVSEEPQEGRPLDVGDSVWPGLTVATLPVLESMLVEARLFDVDDGRASPGDPVIAVVDAFPDLELIGEVVEVDAMAGQAQPRSLRRSFRARIEVEGVDPERMRPGMSVRVAIDKRSDDVLLAPRTALRWSEDVGGVRAEARRAGGSWVGVELGPCNAQQCVVESGLEVGDELSSRWEPGS